MANILVTGASGFVGRSLLSQLREHKHTVRATYNTSNTPNNLPRQHSNNEVTWLRYDLGSEMTDYATLVDGIDMVVHLAARVHKLSDTRDKPDLYMKINTHGTSKLASEAAKRGVKRFVYLSTIKVHGEKTTRFPDGRFQSLNEMDLPMPVEPYAISKLEAEKSVINICRDSGMKCIIYRPPLIYGPYVKANFYRLISIIDKGLPLPLALVNNRRSLLYVDNLSHAILAAVNQQDLKSEIYLISDIDISIPDLVAKIAYSLDKKPLIFPFPISVLKTAAACVGKKDMVDRLTESMLIDNSKFITEFQWTPPVSFNQGIQNTVDWYKKTLQVNS